MTNIDQQPQVNNPGRLERVGDFISNRRHNTMLYLGLTAATIGGVIGYSTFDSDSPDSDSSANAMSNENGNENNSAIERTIEDENGNAVDVLKPGVVGEGACGPKVDPDVIQARMDEGLPVVKPSETAAFFDKYPQMEEEFNDFYNENYGEDLLEYIFTKPVLNTEVLGDQTDEDSSVARRMTARMEALTLTDSVDVQNHYCDPATGEIFEVNNINRLQEGEQVWALPITIGDIKNLVEDGVAIPEELVTMLVEDKEEHEDSDDKVAMAILVQRLACNNPLLERDDDETTTTSSIPEETSSSTTTSIPEEETSSSTTTITVPPKYDDGEGPDGNPTVTTVEEPEPQPEPEPTLAPTSSTTSTAPPNTIASTSTTEAPTVTVQRP